MRMKILSFGDYIASADTSSAEVARPLDCDTTVSGNDTTPSDGDTTPSDGDTTPSDGDTTPSDGDTIPSDGDTTPSDGDTTPSDDGALHSVLHDLREKLAEKDSDVNDLADSLRSFVTHMVETEEMQAEKEALEQAEEEAQAQALADLKASSLSVPGYEDWEYPISVEYTVYPYGAGYYMDATQEFDSPEAFMSRHEENVSFCQPGGTLKDYYIRYVYDAGGTMVYDYKAGVEEPPPEEPKEDLFPAILEALQGIDARLDSMGADVSTISANALDYHTGMLATQDDIRQLQTMNLVTNMAIGFSIFLFLGYTIAHGFWQRMKAG